MATKARKHLTPEQIQAWWQAHRDDLLGELGMNHWGIDLVTADLSGTDRENVAGQAGHTAANIKAAHHYEEARITIDPEQCPDEKRLETYVEHELMHAMTSAWRNATGVGRAIIWDSNRRAFQAFEIAVAQADERCVCDLLRMLRNVREYRAKKEEPCSQSASPSPSPQTSRRPSRKRSRPDDPPIAFLPARSP